MLSTLGELARPAKPARATSTREPPLRVSANASIYSHSGIQQTTDTHNSLTMGGIGQSHHSNYFVASQLSDTLVVVRGQADSAYLLPGAGKWNKSSMTDYLRTVAYLPQSDVFVVVDRATVVDASKAKVWRWQMKDIPQVNGNTFTAPFIPTVTTDATETAVTFGIHRVTVPLDQAQLVQFETASTLRDP